MVWISWITIADFPTRVDTVYEYGRAHRIIISPQTEKQCFCVHGLSDSVSRM